MSLRDLFGLSNSSDDTDGPVSDYDGKPLRTYHFNAERDGRPITVYSSWKPGDPAR
jgi:hypothetical protein